MRLIAFPENTSYILEIVIGLKLKIQEKFIYMHYKLILLKMMLKLMMMKQ